MALPINYGLADKIAELSSALPIKFLRI